MQLLASIRQHAGAVYALSAGHPGTFYSGSGDCYVAAWNLNTFVQEKFTVKLEAPVYTVCFIKEYNFLLIGLSNGSIHVVDVKEKKEIKHFIQHQQGVFHLQYSWKRQQFYSVGGDGLFCVWGLHDLKLKLALPLTQDKIRKIAISPDEELLSLACGDGIVRVFETGYFNEIQQLKAHSMSVNSLCFIDHEILLSGGKDAHLCVWNLKEKQALIKSIPAHNFAIYAIVKSPDGNYFATASRDKTIKIWDAKNYSVLQRIDHKSDGHKNSVNDLLWIEDKLISAGDDRSVKLFASTGSAN